MLSPNVLDKVFSRNKIEPMKPGLYLKKTVILAWVAFIGMVLAARSQSFSLTASSNAASASAFVVHEPVIPSVAFDHVPLSSAIGDLGRQANINFIIDKRLMDWWGYTDDFGRDLHNEPMVDIHWTNLTARAAFLCLLQEHHLILLDDPVTSVARVTYPGQTLPLIDANMFGNDTNIAPLIEFEEVPITVALENLARQAKLNYILDPQIGYGQPDRNGRIKPEPVLNFRWQNVSAKQVLIALYENGDWTISKEPASPVLLIRAKNHPAHFIDVTLLGDDTKTIPLIEFQDVPLSVALENLARQANFKCTIRLQIGNMPTIASATIVSIRWQKITAKAAFISLCENYDLVITKDPATGAVEVKPPD
jgi:hypothetical protein